MRLYDVGLMIIIPLVAAILAASHVVVTNNKELEQIGEPCNYGRKTCVKIVIKGEKR